MHRVVERAVEFNVPVYCALTHYKGAFNALNRTTLGRVLGLFLSGPASLYFDAIAIGFEFKLFRGVQQGFPASPSFFTVAFSRVC